MHAHEEQRNDHPAAAKVPRGDAEAASRAHPDLSAALRPDSVIALQRMIGNAALTRLLAGDVAVQRSPVHGVLRSPGRPLDGAVRADMEARLGADFSDVRVHTDRTAHESAEAVGAEAYTSSSHIAFRQGRYDTTSHSGRERLAHELTHVVQQRRGPVAGTTTDDGLTVSDPSDRFEREAERVAARAMAGGTPALAEQPAPTSATDGGTVVARMISTADFLARTKATWSRGNKVVPIDRALAAYHAVPQNDFTARRTALKNLVRACESYLNTSKSQTFGPQVGDVNREAHDELKAVTVPALVQETKQRAAGHQVIYQALIDAEGQTDRVDRLRALLRAQELLLAEIGNGNAATEDDLVFVSSKLMEWQSHVAGSLTAEEQRLVVEDDLGLLARMRVDQAVPQITRDVLTDLLAHRDLVDFRVGTPGTTLAGPDSPGKYTLKNMSNPPLGTTERLGALTHELTHVDAGEAYANTEILLLFQRGATDDQVAQLAVGRKNEIELLRTRLHQFAGLDNSQRRLFEGKLDYTLSKTRLMSYALSFKEKEKIDQATFDRIVHLDTLTKPNSGLLVEYDTVINQLLIYLHRWGVDPAEPLYVETRRIAGQQRGERQAGHAAQAQAAAPAATTQPQSQT
ncbi:eCIS core domain-containing protein [Saccharothrix hoggarensis]|uniref:DUF4157 domain-containing protein n=1 Tax=Saccharothrix hoggarensis TaxID=913853 RepID=A0ABW3R4N0_9PSEU